MSMHGPDKSKDPSLDQGLEDLGRAYGRLAQEQPPELLDQAILNKARRELKARPRWMLFGWPHAVSTAAVFVLAISLVVNQRDTARVEESAEFDRAQDSSELAPASGPADQNSTPRASAERRGLQKSTKAPPVDALKMEVTAEAATAPEDVRPEETGFMMEYAPAAAVVAEPEALAAPDDTTAVKEQQARRDAEDVEQRLLKIMRLKMVGDESWRTALDAFLEQYPDYPLPHELRR